MRIVRMSEIYREEMEELVSVAMAAAQRREDEEGFRGLRRNNVDCEEVDGNDKVVCVTSGFTFLGRAVVERLLLHGYYVRVIVENQGDVERMSEMETSRKETGAFYGGTEAVAAKLTDVQSLVEAFEGCSGVFHTTAFVDPSGVSGYSKFMADAEAKVSENVMEACARTQSVRKCVLTSSLLACIWPTGTRSDLPSVVNHATWSDEALCTNNKLWYALGKLRAEKIAWKIAEDKGLKLSTICPGLITGHDFSNQNSTPTIAYLKGAQEMYANGLLATVDVNTVAKAHVRVYEAMKKTAFGRYICYDRVIVREDEAAALAKQTGIPLRKICGESYGDSTAPFQLSDRKLASLVSRTPRSCYDENC